MTNGDPTGTKAMSKEISYEVKLFTDRKAFPKYPMFEVEKVDTPPSSPATKPTYKKVEASEDILTLNKPIRICIKDNGAADGGEDDDNKAKFYAKRGLAKLINIFVPFRLEVAKFEANKKVAMNKNDRVMAVFEVIDPPEEVSIIKGPRPDIPTSRTGKQFIEDLIKQTQSGKNKEDDNCIQDFAPELFQKKCRSDRKKVKAESILWRKKGKKREPIKPLPSNEFIGFAPISVKNKGARIYFNPPPVLGDNYSFKITLTNEKWGNITLRQPAQTPTITIWKRVKIELIALQDGVNYNTVKWKEVENAYGDAFIDVLQPPNDRRHRVVISKNEWIKYLAVHVYSTWKHREWLAYRRKDRDRSLRTDLDKFSFPQNPDLLPTDGSNDSDHTSRQLLKKLTKQIFNAHLSRQDARNINNPLKGASIGLCILCVRPPNPNPSWGGVYLKSLGGKKFMMVEAADVTNTFVHEMGHALFLSHGATKFIHDITDPVIVECKIGGSTGPYWDQHYSEDTVSCPMSYACSFYDEKGIKRVKNPTDWHFCGVCLLLLRFYSAEQLSEISKPNGIFRKLNYFKSKPKIAEAVEFTLGSSRCLVDWTYQNSLTINVTETKRLLVIYPREGVTNNYGKDFYKDVCHHPRGKWVSSQPRIATVTPRIMEDIWISELTASAPTPLGKPVEIKFQIVYGPNKNDVNESPPLLVTVTR